jgi:hypothetical protein
MHDMSPNDPTKNAVSRAAGEVVSSAGAAHDSVEDAPAYPIRRFRRGGAAGRRRGDAAGSKAVKAESFLMRRFLPITGAVLMIGAAVTAIGSSDDVMGKIRILIALLTGPQGPEIVRSGDYLTWNLPDSQVAIPILVCALILGAIVIVTRNVRSLWMQTVSLTFWYPLSAWWILATALSTNAWLFYGFIMTSTLIFVATFIRNINGRVNGYRRTMRRLESALIVSNSLLFYLPLLLVFGVVFPIHSFILPVTVLVGAFHLAAISVAARKKALYHWEPYLLITGFIVCLIPGLILDPPARFRDLSYFPILGASFSVFLALFSRRAHGPLAIRASLATLSAALGFYLFQWALNYGPPLLAGGHGLARGPCYDGFVAGLALAVATFFLHEHLGKHDSPLPKPRSNRAIYLKVLSVGLLVPSYLAGFLLFYYLTPVAWKQQSQFATFGSSFTALYCSAIIFWLARRGSWLLKFLLAFATVLAVVHLFLAHSQAGGLRDAFAYSGVIDSAGLGLHVSMVVLFLGLLFSMMVNLRRAFAETGHLVFYHSYFPIMLTALVLLELDEIVALSGRPDATAMGVNLDTTHGFPWSFTVMGCALVFIAIGFVRKMRLLRIVAILLFFLGVAKVLFYDLSQIDASSKALCLLLLGAGILAVTFVYPTVRRRLAHRAR